MLTGTLRWLRAQRHALAAGALLLAMAGCATTRTGPPAGPASLDHLWQQYERAVEDTRYPLPVRVSRELVPIATWFEGLVWDDSRQQVLMVTFTKAAWFTPGEMELSRDTWFTAVPFLQRFCRDSHLQGKRLDVRLEQRLGLPPSNTSDAFAEVWIKPTDLFRPCPDPEISDRECQVNLTAGPVDRNAPCPWSAAQQQQVSGRFATVSRQHLDWMCANWTSSRPPGQPRQGYPWTALGYTYDWAPSAPSHVGESEFVAPKGTSVTIRRIVPVAQYCQPAADRDGRP